MTDAAEESKRAPAPPRISLAALFLRFLRHGLLAFGGPVAQIEALRADLVQRERWTSDERFLRTLAVYQALPGPEATEMSCWFGHLVRGRIGAFLAGLGFVLPGFVFVLGCAMAYGREGLHDPWLLAAFAGVQPAVVAIVVRAVSKLAKGALRPRGAFVAGVAGLAGGVLDVPFAVPVVFGAGWVALRSASAVARSAWMVAGIAVAVWSLGAASGAPAESVSVGPATPWSLLGSGLEAGLLTFGGAYTAVPFVRADAVGANGWLTEAQFLDAIAIAGVLPTPLVMFTTFVGYLAGGFPGACAITLGVFAPAFSFSLIGHRWIERLVESPRLHAVLDGVAASVVGLVAATAVHLCLSHLQDARGLCAFGVASALAFGMRSRLVALAVVAAGAAVGLAFG